MNLSVPIPLDRTRHDPPCPVLVLPVARDGASPRDVEFVVDTGADRTAIPRAAATALGFDPATARPHPVTDFDGTASTVRSVDSS